MKMSDPDMVQYYIVNEELTMSAGKIAAQVAHAATTLTLHTIFNEKEKGNQESFQAWLNTGQKKIVLRLTCSG
jgi:PTH2 family peptidyl-tRNA hydrolase